VRADSPLLKIAPPPSRRLLGSKQSGTHWNPNCLYNKSWLPLYVRQRNGTVIWHQHVLLVTSGIIQSRTELILRLVTLNFDFPYSKLRYRYYSYWRTYFKWIFWTFCRTFRSWVSSSDGRTDAVLTFSRNYCVCESQQRGRNFVAVDTVHIWDKHGIDRPISRLLG